jgi:hypothetical protein
LQLGTRWWLDILQICIYIYHQNKTKDDAVFFMKIRIKLYFGYNCDMIPGNTISVSSNLLLYLHHYVPLMEFEIKYNYQDRLVIFFCILLNESVFIIINYYSRRHVCNKWLAPFIGVII